MKLIWALVEDLTIPANGVNSCLLSTWSPYSSKNISGYIFINFLFSNHYQWVKTHARTCGWSDNTLPWGRSIFGIIVLLFLVKMRHHQVMLQIYGIFVDNGVIYCNLTYSLCGIDKWMHWCSFHVNGACPVCFRNRNK